MTRFFAPVLGLATSLATSSFAVQAQSGVQTQPAPIVRAYPGAGGSSGYVSGGQDDRSVSAVTSSRPIPGVLVRVGVDGSVETVTADANGTELRVTHGRANINVHQPAANSELLVDLPGGQVSLVKDGLYTFNDDTNTVRVVKGEAYAYPGPSGPNVKGIRVKEYQEVAFGSASGVRSVDVNPQEAWADVLPGAGDNGEPAGGYGYRGYGYAPYSGGYYGYPYPVYPGYVGYGWGYPGWGFGYPYGYGFGVGFGVGFGYYGGYRGGYVYRGYHR